ncbi:MAG: hypothetical protein Q4F67_11650 [Propionibacteriaceae bacterium]|nr:hypothetical protein [Propionibacteriaceae bacterium]
MAARLTKAVLAGGRVFPVGTAREGEAEAIPAGDWWSDFEAAEQAADEPGESGDVDEDGDKAADESGDNGAGHVEGDAAGEADEEPGDEVPSESWTVAQIKQYADDRGIDLGGATVKADMLAVINGGE